MGCHVNELKIKLVEIMVIISVNVHVNEIRKYVRLLFSLNVQQLLFSPFLFEVDWASSFERTR